MVETVSASQKIFPKLNMDKVEMWCLSVCIAKPDYKRPSFSAVVYFFKTEEEAKQQLKESKIEFIADFDTSEDERISTLNEESDAGLIEELFQKTSEYESFYENGYMEVEPFNAKIFQVEAGLEVEM
jgi:hypothetical protein